jgi:hypothetical protein
MRVWFLFFMTLLTSFSAFAQFPNATFFKKIYSWNVGDWGGCDVSCGWGTMYRSVDCQTRNYVTVPNNYCYSSQPYSSDSCYAGSCCAPNVGQTCYAEVPSSGYFNSGDCSMPGMCSSCTYGSVSYCTGAGLHKCSCYEGTVQCDGSCFWY